MPQKKGRTALHYASAFGRTDCARLLLEAGAAKDATDSVRVTFGVLIALNG